jgi:excisionase family DNA binding protein
MLEDNLRDGGERRLLRDRGVAAVLDISVRTVWKLVAAGALPAPIRLGRSTRWRTADIERWLAAAAGKEVDRAS